MGILNYVNDVMQRIKQKGYEKRAEAVVNDAYLSFVINELRALAEMDAECFEFHTRSDQIFVDCVYSEKHVPQRRWRIIPHNPRDDDRNERISRKVRMQSNALPEQAPGYATECMSA